MVTDEMTAGISVSQRRWAQGSTPSMRPAAYHGAGRRLMPHVRRAAAGAGTGAAKCDIRLYAWSRRVAIGQCRPAEAQCFSIEQ